MKYAKKNIFVICHTSFASTILNELYIECLLVFFLNFHINNFISFFDPPNKCSLIFFFAK